MLRRATRTCTLCSRACIAVVYEAACHCGIFCCLQQNFPHSPDLLLERDPHVEGATTQRTKDFVLRYTTTKILQRPQAYRCSFNAYESKGNNKKKQAG